MPRRDRELVESLICKHTKSGLGNMNGHGHLSLRLAGCCRGSRVKSPWSKAKSIKFKFIFSQSLPFCHGWCIVSVDSHKITPIAPLINIAYSVQTTVFRHDCWANPKGEGVECRWLFLQWNQVDVKAPLCRRILFCRLFGIFIRNELKLVDFYFLCVYVNRKWQVWDCDSVLNFRFVVLLFILSLGTFDRSRYTLQLSLVGFYLLYFAICLLLQFLRTFRLGQPYNLGKKTVGLPDSEVMVLYCSVVDIIWPFQPICCSSHWHSFFKYFLPNNWHWSRCFWQYSLHNTGCWIKF